MLNDFLETLLFFYQSLNFQSTNYNIHWLVAPFILIYVFKTIDHKVILSSINPLYTTTNCIFQVGDYLYCQSKQLTILCIISD